ncbi:unnamed protein product [Adineta ricciae]|uniref:Uncharacterized protein n=1 Tax=Adineta ricciae TaxID=249248 RepID=A0A813UZK0_ADIRI|nr:unnamed protein product [Adineta ricciae]
MSTKTLFPSATHINDRYFFHTKRSTKHKSNQTSPLLTKRYKFSSTTQADPIYSSSTQQIGQRSHSSDSNRYYFSSDSTMKYSPLTFTYLPTGSYFEPRSMKLVEEATTILTSDTPYLFSNTTESDRYPSTTSTFIKTDDKWPYRRQPSQKMTNNMRTFARHTTSLSPERQQAIPRTDTVTSTNGSLSILRRSPTGKSTSVHFQPVSTVRSYLTEARERLSGKRHLPLPESFDKSVDRLVSSVNKKYRSQQPSNVHSSSATSSFSYISQYYAKEEEILNECSLETDHEQQRLYSNSNTNRAHTQIMKNLNKSLLDRTYQDDKSRFKHVEHNSRRHLRSYESQALRRELNYNLIRSFSTSYLDDLRSEDIRYRQTRRRSSAYTYEDIQDIYSPSVLETFKTKASVDRERHIRRQKSIPPEQLSPVSSSGYSPIMTGSCNDNMDTQIGSFEIDQRSYISISQTPGNVRLDVDVFYEIMQESFRGVDAFIAGHVSRASQYTKHKSAKSQSKIPDNDSDIDIKSNSSFWSDEDEGLQTEDNHQRKTIPHQRKLSRYLSAVNRSLLDRPSDLIADFYLSQLNRNMQDSVRHVEIIARDKAYKNEIIDGVRAQLNRSLSAEHLFHVRKEHLRYKQPFHAPTSFTTEDVADIYKPSILENYKRKIAIELERRRRERPAQQASGMSSTSTHISNTHLNNNIVRASHPPIIEYRHGNPARSDIPIVQTKEIVMGRARRTLTNDGDEIITHHVSTTLPPAIYSDCRKPPPSPSRKRKIRIIATIHDHREEPMVTDVDSQELIDKKRSCIRQHERNDGEMNDAVSMSKQVINSHLLTTVPQRPPAKIYTNNQPTKPVEVCQANVVEPDDHHLSMVSINQTVAVQQTQSLRIPVHDYRHATMLTSPQHPLSLADQSCDEQLTQFNVQQPEYEHGSLLRTQNEQIAKIQQDIPIFEVLRNSHPSIPVANNVNEIQSNNEHSLYTPHVNEQPTVLHSSQVQQLEQTGENNVDEQSIEFLDESIKIDEQLPEVEKTTVQMEYSYVASIIQLPINHSILPASLVGDLLPSAEIQHATEVTDDNYYLRPCEVVQENVRMPIITDNTDWRGEQVEIIPDESLLFTSQHAQYTYSEPIEYAQVQINRVGQNITILDHEEQVKTLTDHSTLVQRQQQVALQINDAPILEKLPQSKTIVTLNYANHNQRKRVTSQDDEDAPSTSSFNEIEAYLNDFEETLNHEQHLPLINQISLSHDTSMVARHHERPTRSLPLDWFQPTGHPHDEQLVEQTTVINDLDTLPHEGTLHRQQIEVKCANINILTDTDAYYGEEKSSNSTLVDAQNNTHIPDILSHHSLTHEIFDKDNDSITCVLNNTVINPQPAENILPSSSVTTTTLLSQSSPPPTSSSTAPPPPGVPIVYFLDALAVESNQANNPMKNFLLTIGFGQNDTNEITNTVSVGDQLSRPTWVNRSTPDKISTLSTIIHQDGQPIQQALQETKLHYAIESQIEDDDIAFVIPPHRLEFGHDLSENVQKPLCALFELPHLHLPIINEIYVYRMSFHHDFPLFHPPDILPHVLVAKTHDDHMLLPIDCRRTQPMILSSAKTLDLLDLEQDIEVFTKTLDVPSYIEHCHIQPLHPFPETCYAEITQPEILGKHETKFLLNIKQDEVKLNRELCLRSSLHAFCFPDYPTNPHASASL